MKTPTGGLVAPTWDGEPSSDVFIHVAYCTDPAYVEKAMGTTHDLVIDLMGPTRRGGIQWGLINGADDITEWLGRYRESAPGLDLAPILADIAAHPGGTLLITYAAGEAPK